SLDATIRSLDPRTKGLSGMHVTMPRSRTASHHHDVEIAVRFDHFDCRNIAAARTIQLGVRDALGLSFAHSYPVKYWDVRAANPGAHWVGQDSSQPILGQIDEHDGWARMITQHDCVNR